MRRFEKFMLLSATAALSALLTVGCEKNKSDADEPAQPTEEATEQPSTPTATDTEHPDHPAANDDAATEAGAGEGEHPSEDDESADKHEHPAGEHPK